MINKYSTLIVLISSFALFSCDRSSTPPDKVLPVVVSTKPASAQIDVKLDEIIEVTLNKKVSNFTKATFNIYPVETGVPNKDKPVLFIDKPFIYNPATKTYRITIQPNQLQAAMLYQATLSDVKDSLGNVIASSCVWQFATEGFITTPYMGLFNTGACATPPKTAPAAPLAVTVSVAYGRALISWELDNSKGRPDNFIIEKSTDDKNTFEQVANYEFADNNNRFNLSVNDFTLKIDTPHFYRVIAVNNYDKSTATESTAVTPTKDSIKPVSILNPDKPGTLNVFGSSVAFSPDNNTLAVGNVSADSETVSNIGSVQIFIKSGSTWNFAYEIFSQTAKEKNLFGSSLAFSPDGNTLAVGETLGEIDGGVADSGVVQLFTRSGTTWEQKPTNGVVLTSQTAAAKNNFGLSIAFSPDGLTLAVGEFLGEPSGGITDSGSVQLFTRSGSDWNSMPTSELVIVSQSPGANFWFGYSLAFSPIGNTLAVGELKALPNPNPANIGTGTVQIFTKSGTAWTNIQVLDNSSQLSAICCYFGRALAFSQDGATLAISEGDLSLTSKAGYVLLYTQTGTNWSQAQAIADNPAAGGLTHFGESISFSPIRANLLVVSNPEIGREQLSVADVDIVELITNNGTTWLRNKSATTILTPGNPLPGNRFGARLTFSPDGLTLVVSEAGHINIYDTNQFP
ncbi:MAG: Ig-like domain-containing protein [Thiohalomonadales bacterium]